MDREEFIEELNEEIRNLKRLKDEMKSVLSGIGEKPSFTEIRTSTSILHDFYSGVEKIFKRIALVIDNSLPTGEAWHIELLAQMAKPFKNICPAVISEELFEKLKEYFKFRHLFRHIYGFELKWERFKELCIRLEDIFNKLRSEIEKFMKVMMKND